MTSSPVQGLATPTSDIDLVSVTTDTLSANRMATQIYVGDHHCEVVAVSPDELERTLGSMRELAAAPTLRVMRNYKSWQKKQTISAKYVERIINGVTPDFEIANADYLPDLAIVWSRRASQAMLANTVSMRLSLRAGELRAPVAYAIETVLSGMDALLCDAGYVYSNKKWILTRWSNHEGHAFSGNPLSGELASLRGLYDDVRARLGGSLPASLADRVQSVQAAILGRFGIGDADAAVSFVKPEGAKVMAFGQGAQVALYGGRAALLPEVHVNLAKPVTVGGISDMDAAAARWVLEALRAGFLKMDLAE